MLLLLIVPIIGVGVGSGWGLEGTSIGKIPTSIGRVGSRWGLEGTTIGRILTSLLDGDWKGWIRMWIGRGGD